MFYLPLVIIEDLVLVYTGCKTDTIFICNALLFISCQLDEMKNGGK